MISFLLNKKSVLEDNLVIISSSLNINECFDFANQNIEKEYYYGYKSTGCLCHWPICYLNGCGISKYGNNNDGDIIKICLNMNKKTIDEIFEKKKQEKANNKVTYKANLKIFMSSIFLPTQIKIKLLNNVAEA